MPNPFEQTSMPEENKPQEQTTDFAKKVEAIKKRLELTKNIVEAAEIREKAGYTAEYSIKEGRCSACGAIVPFGKFCAKCSATFLTKQEIQEMKKRIEVTEKIIKRAKTRERAEHKEGKCSACGSEVSKRKFCAKCGAVFLTEQERKDLKEKW